MRCRIQLSYAARETQCFISAIRVHKGDKVEIVGFVSSIRLKKHKLKEKKGAKIV